jgi:3-oxoacyl-[acyl-carrier-protein] synthase II
MFQRPIAVIGMSCRFPNADEPIAFWENILEGRDAIGAVPDERWNCSTLESELGKPGFAYSKEIGADATSDCYDAAFFGITEGEAQRVDPQQGIVLEAAWHACEDARIIPDSLAGQDVGVFIGVSTRDFDRRAASTWQMLNVQSATGSCGAIVANRLSYVLGLTGPSLSIDTACASSLTAIHQACRSLNDGECEMAFAGGVQLILSPTNIIAFSRDGVLSKTGSCKPFSKNADGYVFGEGVGILLLKPLELALRDADPIRAVIRGSAINHNGRSNGLSAPYGVALQRVMRKALDRANIAANTVDYVEAHAVGTLIGDAIEMQAIAKVYAVDRSPLHPCYVGSVKPNVGHLEAASGVAALIKTVLAIEHATLPASLNCSQQSELLRLDHQSLRLCELKQPWLAEDRPRRASVSAFGFGGANAHVIIEQAPTANTPNENAVNKPDADDLTGPWLLMVSARSEAAFLQLCQRYGERLIAEREQGATIDVLRDFCLATAFDRQHHPLRRALLVSNWLDAVTALAHARPAPQAKRHCRVGISLAEHTKKEAAECVSASHSTANTKYKVSDTWEGLSAVLAQIGIKRLYIDANAKPDEAATLMRFAERAAIPASIHNEKSPSLSDCLLIADADEPHAVADFTWNFIDSVAQQRAHLVACLYERGFSLNHGSKISTGASAYPLPLYPFERRRNHLLFDTIAHKHAPQNRPSPI